MGRLEPAEPLPWLSQRHARPGDRRPDRPGAGLEAKGIPPHPPADPGGYLPFLLQAARANLARQGIQDDGSQDYGQTVVGTAAWMYRKRISGEAEPEYLKRLRKDLLLARGREAGT